MNSELALQEAFQAQAAGQILEMAKQEEQKLDKAIQKLETMDEDDFEVLRQRRLEKMKKQAQQRAEWQFYGHGTYSEIPSQQEFFEAAKRSSRIVCHFYRPTTKHCQVVDAHMERLTARHMETKFCKINAEKSPYLVEKLNIYVMPTLLLIKNGETVKHLRGFDEFGGTDEFSNDMFAYVLSSYGVLNFDGGRPDSPTGTATRKGVNSIKMAMGSSVREGIHAGYESNDDS